MVGGAVAVLAAWLRSQRWRLVVVAVSLLLLGSGLAGARLAMLQRGPLMELARGGGRGDMAAVVVSDARVTPTGFWQIVRVSSVGGLRSGRRALLHPNDPLPLGARVVFEATARPLGGDDFEGYLRNLHVAVEVSPVAPVTVARAPPAAVAATTRVRERVRATARQALPPDHAALLSGLVTGDTTGLSDTTADTLRAAGLSHLVAVSGSNVAIVLAGVVVLCGLCRIGARGRRRSAVFAIVWFCVLVRGEPSVLRASAMALLVVAGAALGRGHHAHHSLGAAALLLLLFDPLLAGQLGFALSVLATAGVLIGGPAIAARVPGPRRVALLVGASAGAQLGVAPVLVFSEGGLSLAAVPANLIAVPAAAVASTIGVTAAVVAQVSVPVAAVLAKLAWPAVAVVVVAGRVFADVWTVTPATLMSPVAVLLLVALIMRRRHPALALAAAGTVVAAAVWAPWGGAPPVTRLTLTALDVGQGDALVIEVPRRAGGTPARMLVDGGPDPTLALKLLRERDVGYLDAVVATHPHADHTDGLPGVLARVRTGAVLVGATATGELDEPAASAVAVEVVAHQQRVPVTRVAAGQRFALGRAVVEVLSPPADGSLGAEPNDNSVVLRVTDGPDSILLTGDVEEAAQRRLLQRPDLLRADILKVPHHGGATNAPGFLDAVGATTAVIGVGADNDYGHPNPDVLADLAGARVLRTDTAGTITVAVDGAAAPIAP